jgi:hypothetical protein
MKDFEELGARLTEMVSANLYIRSLFDKHKMWFPQSNTVMEERDRLKPGTPEYQRADGLVWDSYDSMKIPGYFYSPYNSWDFLRQFALSWRRDVAPLLNGRFRLSVAKAKHVLALLDENQIEFDMNLADCPDDDHVSYFLAQSEDFRAFLTKAIDLDEPIECSL